jgi:hypothetical protein
MKLNLSFACLYTNPILAKMMLTRQLLVVTKEANLIEATRRDVAFTSHFVHSIIVNAHFACLTSDMHNLKVLYSRLVCDPSLLRAFVIHHHSHAL